MAAPGIDISGLLRGMRGLDIDSVHCIQLRFEPPDDYKKLVEIPRYLFRVFSRESAGETTSSWVHSASVGVQSPHPTHEIDIFKKKKTTAAEMVNSHLRWIPSSAGEADNLVSWTSSLLYALLYVFYQRAYYDEPFERISLCVIDTTLFPENTFISDLDLIKLFKPYHTRLANLQEMRNWQRPGYHGTYYFGEYLSQGSLKVMDRCKIVHSQQMIDNGLLDLHPRFREFSTWPLKQKPSWANLANELRQPFYHNEPRERMTPQDQMTGIIRVGNLFGVLWRIPVALYLFSLVPFRNDAVSVLAGFERVLPPLLLNEVEQIAATETKVVTTKLPEALEFATNLQLAYISHFKYKRDESMEELKDVLSKAERYCQLLLSQESTTSCEVPTGTAYIAGVIGQMMNMGTKLFQELDAVSSERSSEC